MASKHKKPVSDEEFEAFVRREEAHGEMIEALQVVKERMRGFPPECNAIIAKLIRLNRGRRDDRNALPRLAKLATLSDAECKRQIIAWGEELEAGGRRQ